MRQAYKLLDTNIDRWLSTVKSENELLQNGEYSKIVAAAKAFVRNEQIANAVKVTAETYCGNITPDKGHAVSKKAFNEWAKHAGLRSGESLGELNTELVGILTWGDCLIVLDRTPYAPAGTISARVKLIDPLCVQTPPKYRNKGLVSGMKVILGVVFDVNDIEIGYFVLKAGLDGSKDEHYQYIPCYDDKTGRFVSALVCRPGSRFPGQARGFPMLLAALFSINAIDKLSEFTVREANVKSMLGIVVTTDSVNAPPALGVGDEVFKLNPEPKEGEEGKTNEDKPKVNISQLESGDVPVLPPNTDIKTINNGGNLDISSGIKEQLKLVAAGMGIPYHILLKDFTGINFSAGKLEIDALFRLFDLWNYGPIMRVFSEIYKWVVIEWWLLRGVIPVPAMWENDWIGPGAPDPDPLKSAHAESVRLSTGTVARSSLAGKRGDDYEQTLQQIKDDGEAEKRTLGRSFAIGWAAEKSATIGSSKDDVEEDE
ncbi:MAG: phage portal protein [Fibromonadaceae bacterium]|jgi:capsid protein|nr:phage portal protein [Fibromonadaceae bacterium]